MRSSAVHISFITVTAILMLSLVVVTLMGVLGSMPPESLRKLATVFLNYTYNPYATYMWSASPEAVTAIVWDYRGLDTYFETSVLFGAVVAALMLFREAIGVRDEYIRGVGLSFITKKSTMIVVAMILAVGIATVLHGQLTPGGGFQGGSICAIAPVLLLVVFSKKVLEGLRYRDVIVFRTLGLLGIALTGVSLAIIYLPTGGTVYIFQNQVKYVSGYSMPSYILDVPMGGILWFLNLFEGIAVVFAFIIVFLVFLSSDRLLDRAVVGEDHAY